MADDLTFEQQAKKLRKKRITITQAAHVFRDYGFEDSAKDCGVVAVILSKAIDSLERAHRDAPKEGLFSDSR